MRWQQEYTRVVKRFALRPITIKGDTVWLEFCYIRQRRHLLGYWYNHDFVSQRDWVFYLQEKEEKSTWANIRLTLYLLFGL